MDAERIAKDLRAEPVKELPYFFAEKYGQKLAILDVAEVSEINIKAGQLVAELAAMFPGVTLKQLSDEINASKIRRQTRPERTGENQWQEQ